MIKCFRFMAPFIRKQWLLFFSMPLLCIVWSLKEGFFPYFVKKLVNAASTSTPGDYSLLVCPLITLISLWFSMEVALRICGLIQRKVFPEFRANVYQHCFSKLAKLPTTFFNDHQSGDIAAKMATLPSSLEKILQIVFLHIVSIGCATFVAFGLFLSVHWWFLASAIGWILGYFIILFIFVRRINTDHENHAQKATKLNGAFMDTLKNILDIRLYGRVQAEKERLLGIQQGEMKASKRSTASVEMMKLWHGVLSIAFLGVMLGLLLLGWEKQFLTIGDFMMIPMLTFSMLGMIWWLGNELTVLFRDVGIVSNALEYIHFEGVTETGLQKSLLVREGRIEFKNVNFNYPKNGQIIHDVSLSIGKKYSVGIVGPSGAGKSTLIKLLLSLYRPYSGEITIDGQNILSVEQDSLFENIAVISQEPVLLHRSVYENIVMGDPQATLEQVIVASKLAYSHEFISAFSEGYETIVGEGGVKLSAGQRQRIAIARAFLKNAPILIMDEATSALDSLTEASIHKSMNTLMKDRTTIIIAHRKSTLRNVGHIFVINEGILVEQGSLEKLIESNGLFTKMWKAHDFLS